MPDLFDEEQPVRKQRGAILLRDSIKLLQELERIHGGDLAVQKWMPTQGRIHCKPPVVANIKMVNIAGERREIGMFWHSQDPADQAGDLVIRI